MLAEKLARLTQSNRESYEKAMVKGVETEIKLQIGRMRKRDLLAITERHGDLETKCWDPSDGSKYVKRFKQVLSTNEQPSGAIEFQLVGKITCIVYEQFEQHYARYVDGLNRSLLAERVCDGTSYATFVFLRKEVTRVWEIMLCKGLFIAIIKKVIIKTMVNLAAKLLLKKGVVVLTVPATNGLMAVFVVGILLREVHLFPQKFAKILAEEVAGQLRSGVLAQLWDILVSEAIDLGKENLKDFISQSVN
ncbi:hypothetical protein IQ07DRAFT_676762 [Pyrenochaeta sp. DS3sAY3a]|nr:hypothetical protein IQ07DRAFT_676762 [Pyrenochaeta sp. DS3sAY3a]